MHKKEIEFCTGGGCTAKLGPGVLEKILSKIPKERDADKNLLIGYDSSDDACVYRVSEDCAVVQTLDFFPPMVEDPYLFGQIAAANALSDIYAMGGSVKTALNIVCFPEHMDLNILGQILLGGYEKIKEAGGTLSGGHSIVDEGVKYGLSVMGFVDPNKMWRNNTPCEEDLLLLTKPLGVGLICSAARVGVCDKNTLNLAIDSMRTLNKGTSEILRHYEVHAVTDITGFGLSGHLLEMVGEKYSAEIDTIKIPRIEKALYFAKEFYGTEAAQRNRNHAGDRICFEQVPFAMQELLFDPQTSGGLLVSLSRVEALKALAELKAKGYNCEIIGKISAKKKDAIKIR